MTTTATKILVLELSGANERNRNTYYAFPTTEEAQEFINDAIDTCVKNAITTPVEDGGYGEDGEEEAREYYEGCYEMIEEPNEWQLNQVMEFNDNTI